MRLKIKRILTIITFEYWTVAWDKSPTSQACFRKITLSLESESILVLHEQPPGQDEANLVTHPAQSVTTRAF
jgi:hypothetical protein